MTSYCLTTLLRVCNNPRGIAQGGAGKWNTGNMMKGNHHDDRHKLAGGRNSRLGEIWDA